MLRDLGVTRVRLMTNNPAKADALRAGGVEVVARVPMPTAVTPENLRYLRTKRDRMGHLLEGLDDGIDPDTNGEDRR
jgi:3,4-dihydroxy 2-butanone 4-phosphate synthase/GTP cyclohydrolase II